MNLAILTLNLLTELLTVWAAIKTSKCPFPYSPVEVFLRSWGHSSWHSQPAKLLHCHLQFWSPPLSDHVPMGLFQVSQKQAEKPVWCAVKCAYYTQAKIQTPPGRLQPEAMVSFRTFMNISKPALELQKWAWCISIDYLHLLSRMLKRSRAAWMLGRHQPFHLAECHAYLRCSLQISNHLPQTEHCHQKQQKQNLAHFYCPSLPGCTMCRVILFALEHINGKNNWTEDPVMLLESQNSDVQPTFLSRRKCAVLYSDCQLHVVTECCLAANEIQG